YTGGDILAHGDVFDRRTTFVPWIDRNIAFVNGLAERGLIALHACAGLLGIWFLWTAALRAQRPARVRDAFGLLLAVTPVFARYSMTESSHIWIWCLHAAFACALAELCTRPRCHIESWAILAIAPIAGASIRLESSLLLATALFVAWPALPKLREIR